MIRFQTILAALAIGIVISSAGPAAGEKVLRFTSVSGGAATMDPHSLRTPYNLAATMQVYEALLDIDSNLAIADELIRQIEAIEQHSLAATAPAPEAALDEDEARRLVEDGAADHGGLDVSCCGLQDRR
jgi:hypothetical protein